ncbi:E3 ubiquitin-protein ligase [Rhynchospora pubera]|uniref:E3 ubiquitin-protein ligase n=1 Tax=Rhynchospora pubera TaxID=906938 RepID=A0AAV8HPV5_9POAL|nr:E3 ubiquitin-protein ligase [Rhynchospora pubera]
METTIPNHTISMHEHIIDISREHNVASSSNSNSHNNNNHEEEEELSDADGERGPPSSSSSSSDPPVSMRNTTITRRGEGHQRRHRSPLNSGLWISVELVVNLSQIVAAIVVLSLSKHEHPHAPLFQWVIGYTAGCVATLPHLYWRYVHRNRQVSNQGAAHTARHNSSSQNNSSNQTETNSYTAVSTSNSRLEGAWRNNVISTNPRVHALVDHFKMALDCFFAVWFVVGNVWIFGGHSSSSDAPNLYRLCIAFLTFSCIGYAMPFILCAMICCCLPCIISLMGFREDLNYSRGATQESINALPIYKFRLKRTSTNCNRECSEINLDSHGVDGGGMIGVGTDKERMISAEDAACCICLAKYADNDEVRELTCAHFFHKECVDKWLKINALCPLCKAEVPNSSTGLLGLNLGRRHIDRRVGNDVESQS